MDTGKLDWLGLAAWIIDEDEFLGEDTGELDWLGLAALVHEFPPTAETAGPIIGSSIIGSSIVGSHILRRLTGVS